ncbi:SAM-dependent methyltransferase [Pseudarthrobacter sp. N5]|uniref:SAM-dependent methyltransferase n=1 Tax=Pseudarthrobacter sp. N5 TaxID=3418416 RepID=UPI003CF4F564
MTERGRDHPGAHHQDQGNTHDGAAHLWDEMYRTCPRIWSGKPNPQLVREAAGLKPGRALDLGCGEGADALWLAEQGWTVTAVDVSAVALERAVAHAAEAKYGPRITWVQQDLAAWQPEAEFDLVSAQFLHSPALPWQQSLKAAASAVRPGGTLLIVGHHPDRLPPWGSHISADMLFTPEQLAFELHPTKPGWRLDVAASRERTVDGPDGQRATIADAVLRATREDGWL